MEYNGTWFDVLYEGIMSFANEIHFKALSVERRKDFGL